MFDIFTVMMGYATECTKERLADLFMAQRHSAFFISVFECESAIRKRLNPHKTYLSTLLVRF